MLPETSIKHAKGILLAGSNSDSDTKVTLEFYSDKGSPVTEVFVSVSSKDHDSHFRVNSLSRAKAIANAITILVDDALKSNTP